MLNRTRVTKARICVEVDLTLKSVKGLPIVVLPTNCFWQEAKYEKPGFYCMNCCRQGHTTIVCHVGEHKRADGKPNENKFWKQKKITLKGEVLGSTGEIVEENKRKTTLVFETAPVMKLQKVALLLKALPMIMGRLGESMWRNHYWLSST